MDNFVPAPPLPMPTAADPFGERAKAAWAPAQMPAQQRPPMAVSLETLENRVVELEQSIVELLSRVQPVLTPLAPVGPQQPMPPVPAPVPRSALCGSVDSIALSVAQVTKTVNDAIKRVEV